MEKEKWKRKMAPIYTHVLNRGGRACAALVIRYEPRSEMFYAEPAES
jgi:hypothetical protein